MDTKSLSLEIFNALDDMKAVNIKILDVRHLTPMADYFVIATGNSSKHVSSLAETVEEKLDKIGVYPNHKERT